MTIALLCLTLLLLTLAGCNHSKETKLLGFEATHVKNIEVFNYIVPMEARGMFVTEREDLEEIITVFHKIKINSDASVEDIPEGGESIIFRFKLKDGKEFVVAYSEGIECGEGTLRDPFGFYKVSAASFQALWESLNYDIQTVPATDLPFINN